jgi:AsmA protein
LRLLLIACAGVVLMIVLVLLVSVYLLLQPDRFTAMLQVQARDAGLELSVSSPASPTLFPHPALELEGLTLIARGADMPILLAVRGRLALPWHTLFGGPTVISRLDIDSPRVDLDALQEWLSNLPPRPANEPMQIPRVDAGIRIYGGSVVRGDQLLLRDVTLEAGKLAPDRPFPLDLSAQTADGTPLHLQLSATPHMVADVLQLDDIGLRLSQGNALSLQLTGEARWHGAANALLQLSGKLDHANAGSYNTSLTLTPANQQDPLLLALKLDGKDNHIDLSLPPIALINWWTQLSSSQDPQLTVPPGSGHIEVAKLDTGGIHIEGLSVQAGDDVPAGATSAATPASANAATPHKSK